MKYEGSFIDDKYDGEGSLYDSSYIYFGEWKSDQKNGHIEKYFNEGSFKEEIIEKYSLLVMKASNKFNGFKYYYDGNC